MHCPSCGVEVVEQAGFCHKCGQRLESADEQAFVGKQQEASPMPDPGFLDRQSDDAESAATPGEKFKQAATARNAEDEPEEELWQGGYSSKAMIGAWILSGTISIVLLIVWALYVRTRWLWIAMLVAIVLLWIYQLGKLCYRRMNVRYRLTTQRFVHETGVLRRVTDRIEVIDMDDIAFEQTVIQRLVGVGTIRITSSDKTHPKLVLLGIENVKDVADKIDDIRCSERRRRGLHIESI